MSPPHPAPVAERLGQLSISQDAIPEDARHVATAPPASAERPQALHAEPSAAAPSAAAPPAVGEPEAVKAVAAHSAGSGLDHGAEKVIRPSAPDAYAKLLDRCHLFVGDLHRSTTEEDLQKAFSPYGKIVFAEVKRDKVSGRNLGYGFLKLDTEDGAQRALREMNGVPIKGRRIRINYAQKNCELHVTNLTEDVTKDELEAIFEEHGPLDKEHCVMRPAEPGFAGGKVGPSAIIKFLYRQHAESARDAVNNRVNLHGALLRVDWHVKDNKRFRNKYAPPYPHLDPMAQMPQMMDPKGSINRGWAARPPMHINPYPPILQMKVTVLGPSSSEVRRGSIATAFKRIYEGLPLGEIRQMWPVPAATASGDYRRIFVADIQNTPEGQEGFELLLRESSQQSIVIKGCRVVCEQCLPPQDYQFAQMSPPYYLAAPSPAYSSHLMGFNSQEPSPPSPASSGGVPASSSFPATTAGGSSMVATAVQGAAPFLNLAPAASMGAYMPGVQAQHLQAQQQAPQQLPTAPPQTAQQAQPQHPSSQPPQPQAQPQTYAQHVGPAANPAAGKHMSPQHHPVQSAALGSVPSWEMMYGANGAGTLSAMPAMTMQMSPAGHVADPGVVHPMAAMSKGSQGSVPSEAERDPRGQEYPNYAYSMAMNAQYANAYMNPMMATGYYGSQNVDPNQQAVLEQQYLAAAAMSPSGAQAVNPFYMQYGPGSASPYNMAYTTAGQAAVPVEEGGPVGNDDRKNSPSA